MRPTHQKNIKKHLIRWRSITSWGAIQRYGCTRLAVVINRLRDQGMNIKTVMMPTKYNTHYAKYVRQ